MADGFPPDYFVKQQIDETRRGRLFVVSGPSGVGKDTVIQHFLPLIERVKLSVSATTRSMRPGETQDDPYRFFTEEEFLTLVEMDALLEYAKVNGNYYGTPRKMVDDELQQGNDVLLKIDVQGAAAIRKKIKDTVLIFLMPPSYDELVRRLRARSTENEVQIKLRLLDATKELQEIPHYDYAVLNDNVEHAAERLRFIFEAERCRVRATTTPVLAPSYLL